MTEGSRLKRVVFLCLTLWATQALAAPDESARTEIERLLTRLETSGCQFFRNDSWYDAPRARAHLEKKYQWLLKKDLVSSAEQFIERAATRSSRSNEAYLVRCAGDEALPSAAWLKRELVRIRQ